MKIISVDLYEYFNHQKPENCALDFKCYLHDDQNFPTRRHPAMLVIPGGGYKYCSPREADPIALQYFVKGFNVFIINYSCAPAKYPVAFKEASMAMAYIKLESDELHVVQNKVSAVGFSAGGHLCGCLANLFDDDVLNFLGENKKFVRPDSVLLIYPVVSYLQTPHLGSFENLTGDNTDLANQLSLETRVTPNSSPMFLVTTFGDQVVSCKNSLVLALAYQNAGVPFSFHLFETGPHGLSTATNLVYTAENLPIHSKNYEQWIAHSLNYLEEKGFVITD